MISGVGALYFCNVVNEICLFIISVFFYVCDLICVLIWCPFRLIMKNKCCTTCRIFNWDHLMMFSPLIFVGGFFSISLVVIAFIAWLAWELCVMIYPERFCEMTNAALNAQNAPINFVHSIVKNLDKALLRRCFFIFRWTCGKCCGICLCCKKEVQRT